MSGPTGYIASSGPGLIKSRTGSEYKSLLSLQHSATKAQLMVIYGGNERYANLAVKHVAHMKKDENTRIDEMKNEKRKASPSTPPLYSFSHPPISPVMSYTEPPRETTFSSPSEPPRDTIYGGDMTFDGVNGDEYRFTSNSTSGQRYKLTPRGFFVGSGGEFIPVLKRDGMKLARVMSISNLEKIRRADLEELWVLWRYFEAKTYERGRVDESYGGLVRFTRYHVGKEDHENRFMFTSLLGEELSDIFYELALDGKFRVKLGHDGKLTPTTRDIVQNLYVVNMTEMHEYSYDFGTGETVGDVFKKIWTKFFGSSPPDFSNAPILRERDELDKPTTQPDLASVPASGSASNKFEYLGISKSNNGMQIAFTHDGANFTIDEDGYLNEVDESGKNPKRLTAADIGDISELNFGQPPASALSEEDANYAILWSKFLEHYGNTNTAANTAATVLAGDSSSEDSSDSDTSDDDD